MTTDIHAVAASYEAERAKTALDAQQLAHTREVAGLTAMLKAERARAEFWKAHHAWSCDILDAYLGVLARHGL